MSAAKKNDPLTSKDRELWERVKKSATPLEDRSNLFSSMLASINDDSVVNPLARLGANSTINLEEQLTKRAAAKQVVRPYSSIPSKSPDYIQGHIMNKPAPLDFQLDQKTVRRISKGRTGIDGRVDLHGLTQLQAHNRLFRTIENAWTNDRRIILVITGKGVLGEGILRQAVPRWLSEPEFRMMISGVSQSSQAHGGSGALYVRIKRRRGMNP